MEICKFNFSDFRAAVGPNASVDSGIPSESLEATNDEENDENTLSYTDWLMQQISGSPRPQRKTTVEVATESTVNLYPNECEQPRPRSAHVYAKAEDEPETSNFGDSFTSLRTLTAARQKRSDSVLMKFCSNAHQKYRICAVDLPETVLRNWVAQVVTCLLALHEREIYWGDFNPSNILLDKNGQVVLTHCFTWLRPSKLHSGSPNAKFISPEILQDCASSQATSCGDVWSLGAMLYAMVQGRHFVHQHCNYSLDEVSFPSHSSSELISLIKAMLDPIPNDRIAISQIPSHAFFRSYSWKTS